MNEPGPRVSRFHYLLIFAVAAVGIVSSVLLANTLRRHELRMETLRFARDANVQAMAVQSVIRRNSQTLEGIVSLFQASQAVTRSEFGIFTRPSLEQYPEINALYWVPRVNGSDVERFESQIRADGLPEFHLTEMDTAGSLVRATGREEHYPVLFGASLVDNLPVPGFDLGSQPRHRRAMELARNSGRAVMSERARLVQRAESPFGLLIVQPVYKSVLTPADTQARRAGLRGFVVGEFRIDELLRQAVAQSSLSDIDIALYNEDAQPSERLLYALKAQDDPNAASAPAHSGGFVTQSTAQEGGEDNLTHQVDFIVAGRRLALRMVPGPQYPDTINMAMALLVLLFGVLATLLLVSYLHTIRQRQDALERSEEALRQSHERIQVLSEAVEQSPLPVIITDPNCRIQYLNPSFTRETGYELDELKGRDAGTLNKEGNTPSPVVETMWEQLSSGRPFKGEFQNRRKNGEVYTVEAFIAPIRSIEGDVNHYVSWQYDVTETRNISLELENHRSSLQKLVELRTADLEAAKSRLEDNEFAMNAVGIGIEWLDFETGQYLYVNRFNAEILGYTPREMCRMHLWDVDPTVTPENYAEVRAHIRESGYLRIESVHRSRQGRDIPVEVTVHFHEGESEGQRRFIGFVTDISERIAARSRLEHSEKLLKEAQRINRIAHWEWDFERRRMVWSDEMYRIFEIDRTVVEPTFELLREQLSPADQALSDGALSKALSGGGRQTLTHQLPMPDGRIKYLVEQAEVELDDSGDPLRAMGTVQDITEQENSARQLEKALIRAEAATQAKSRFLANMSHEIRTPLSVILGTVDLMGTRVSDEWMRRRLGRITQAGEHLSSIINDILDHAKIDAGKIELSPVDFQLKRLMGGVVDVVSPKAGAKGLTVEMDTSGDIPARLHGDETRLRQCLLNFATNAVKFTEKGRVRLHAEIDQRGRDGRVLLRFSVTDTGIGINVREKERLFQEFSQADASMTRRFGGTGLGLVITRQLAELMGGTVGLDSEPGRGSTFWFTAWLTPVEPARSDREEPVDEPIQAMAFDKVDARVLVVDDQQDNVDILSTALEHFGLQADSASDGMEALERVRETDYGLVLMDMQMPLMDGPMATREIRKLPGRQRLPILAVTANAFEDDRQVCLQAGMNDFLSKPIRLRSLHEVLRKWLRQPDAVPVSTDKAADAETTSALDPMSVRLGPPPDGIELLQAVKLANGNWEKHGERLARFAGKYADEGARITRQLQAGNYDAALNQAHALKGTAGMLGAEKIARVAESIETTLKQHTKPPMTELTASAEQLDEALSELADWLAGKHAD